MLRISYAKRGDEWMLRIEGSNHERGKLNKGDQLAVTKRDGSTKTEVLGQAIDIQRDYTMALIATPKTVSRRIRQGQRDYERQRNGDRIYRGEANRTYHRDGTVTHRSPNGRAWTEY